MRTFKLIGAMALVLAFSAFTVASASAEEILWKLLPGSVGETFTGKSGAGSLQQEGGATISCTSSTLLLTDIIEGKEVHSELVKEGSTGEKDATLALGILHFVGCKTLFTGANSLGDEKEVILAHIEIHTCMIKKEHFGLLILVLPLHIEVPLVKTLILVEGLFIALIEPLVGDKKHFILNITQSGGLQTIKLCEGGPEESLKAKVNNEEVKLAGEEAAEGLLLFDGTKDATGETMMEK